MWGHFFITQCDGKLESNFSVSAAVHRWRPQLGVVDIHSGMVRMCLLHVKRQGDLVRVPFKNNLNCVQTSARKTDATRLFSAQCYCSCDMLFNPLYSWSGFVFRSLTMCHVNIFRSLTQQLLYGLASNSWFYQGGVLHLNTIFVCTHEYLRAHHLLLSTWYRLDEIKLAKIKQAAHLHVVLIFFVTNVCCHKPH